MATATASLTPSLTEVFGPSTNQKTIGIMHVTAFSSDRTAAEAARVALAATRSTWISVGNTTDGNKAGAMLTLKDGAANAKTITAASGTYLSALEAVMDAPMSTVVAVS
jgi:hypothetical protein